MLNWPSSFCNPWWGNLGKSNPEKNSNPKSVKLNKDLKIHLKYKDAMSLFLFIL